MEKKKKRINSRQKGAAGERELSNFLKLHGWQARRGQQFSGGTDSPDVVSNFPFHIECKRVQNLDIGDAYEQALRDANDKVPASVIHRKDREDWLATIELKEFLELGFDSKVRAVLHKEGAHWLVTLPLLDLLDGIDSKLIDSL